MKILIQWARANPTDWEEIDSSQWSATPKKPLPQAGHGREAMDDSPGWISAINVQGVIFSGYDHYAIEQIVEGGVRVHVWIDDVDDYPLAEHYARVREFLPLAPDPNFGGAFNTRQSQKVYANPGMTAKLDRHRPAQGYDFPEFPLSQWQRPPGNITRHGVWQDDVTHTASEQTRSKRGWREWTEGIPASEIRDGKLRPQRTAGKWSRAKGTRTYFLHNIDTVDGPHTVTGGGEFGMRRFTTQAANTAVVILGGGDQISVHAFTTPAGEPGSSAWPTGTYRCQIDCTALGADVSFGVLNLGSGTGHFARLNSSLSEQETKQQVESAFTATGLRLATTGSVSWTSGAAGDRFEVLIAASRAANHGNQSFDCDFREADDFADGPWSSDLADSVAVTDSASGVIVTGGTLFTRNPQDTAAVSDSAATSLDYERDVQDTGAVTDQAASSLDYERTASDSVSSADSASTSLDYERTASDTAAATDSIGAGMQVEANPQDTVSVSDAVSTELEYHRSLADAAVSADQVTRAHDAVRNLAADSIVATDSVGAGMQVEASPQDTASVADAASAMLDYVRTVSDSPSVVGQALRTVTFERSASDAVSQTDSVGAGLQAEASASDAVSLSDQSTTELNYERNPQDTAATSSTASTNLGFSRANGDTAIVTDQATAEVLAEIQVTVSDSVSTADSTSRAVAYERPQVDSAVAADQASTSLDYLVNPGDSVTLSDAAGTSICFERGVSDASVLADQVSAEIVQGVLTRTASDSATISDSLAKAAQFARANSDAVSVSDSVSVQIGVIGFGSTKPFFSSSPVDTERLSAIVGKGTTTNYQ